METDNTMSSFDKTFDRTFRGRSINVPSIPAPLSDCGTTLMYLTLAGWAFWTFTARRDTKLVVRSVGAFTQRGLSIDTQKQSLPGYVLRTGNLTEAEAEHVVGLLSSTAVYWLRKDAAGGVSPTPVRVETTDVTPWTQARSRTEMDIVISLPFVNSLRR